MLWARFTVAKDIILLNLRKVLTPEEAENKKEKMREDSRNRRHSLHEQIVPIPPQQIPDVEAEEYNATLYEAG